MNTSTDIRGKLSAAAMFIIIPVLLFLLPVCACTPKGDPIVNVIVDERLNRKEPEELTRGYYSVYPGGRIRRISEFEPDSAEMFTAGPGNFKSSITDGRVTNDIEATVLTDINGNTLEADSEQTEILSAVAANEEHEIIGLTLIKTDSGYYAFVRHNVNLWDPRTLYYYNSGAKQLEKLYIWDGAELVGIAQPQQSNDQF